MSAEETMIDDKGRNCSAPESRTPHRSSKRGRLRPRSRSAPSWASGPVATPVAELSRCRIVSVTASVIVSLIARQFTGESVRSGHLDAQYHDGISLEWTAVEVQPWYQALAHLAPATPRPRETPGRQKHTPTHSRVCRTPQRAVECGGPGGRLSSNRKERDVKILDIDMDSTLLDFRAKLNGIDQKLRSTEVARTVPGLFSSCRWRSALDAFTRSCPRSFDTYILSTAPWKEPSAWQHRSVGHYTSASDRGLNAGSVHHRT